MDEKNKSISISKKWVDISYYFFCYLFGLHKKPRHEAYRTCAMMTLVFIALCTAAGVFTAYHSLKEARISNVQALKSHELNRRITYFNAISTPMTPYPLVKDGLRFIESRNQINNLNIGNGVSWFEHSFNGSLGAVTDSTFRYSNIEFEDINLLDADMIFSDLILRPKISTPILELFLMQSALTIYDESNQIEPLETIDSKKNSSIVNIYDTNRESTIKLHRSEVFINGLKSSLSIEGVNCPLEKESLPHYLLRELQFRREILFSENRPAEWEEHSLLFNNRFYEEYIEPKVMPKRSELKLRTSGNRIIIDNVKDNKIMIKGEVDLTMIADSSPNSIKMVGSPAIGNLTTLSNVATHISYGNPSKLKTNAISKKLNDSHCESELNNVNYPQVFFVSDASNVSFSFFNNGSSYEQILTPIVVVIKNSNVSISGNVKSFTVIHDNQSDLNIFQKRAFKSEAYTKCSLLPCRDTNSHLKTFDWRTRLNIDSLTKQLSEKMTVMSHFSLKTQGVSSNVTIEDIMNIENMSHQYLFSSEQ